MWIVKLALRRPYTFVVAALLILVLGALSARRARTDIFPEVDLPVVTVIWTYRGMDTTEFEKRVTTYSEYAISSNVNNIRRMESQTVNGVSVIRIHFHPGSDVNAAVAQVTAVSQAIRQVMPPGIQPPIILRFNASSVPVLQLAMSSPTMAESDIYNYGLYILRQQLSTIPGITLPTPYGGVERQIQVDLNPELMRARGVSAKDVSDAMNAYNLAAPTGTAKIGDQQYPVTLNNTPLAADAFNAIPIKTIGGTTIYVRDVAQVRDGFQSQTTVVRRDGTRGVLITLLKNGDASTLDLVKAVKAALPTIQAAAPPDLQIEMLFDQSLFVEAAVDGVIHESVIAAGLTALMILVFLGSWRSTLIVAVSIPLSILASIAMLYSLGYTLNVMTLGGLALAVGILVDDATVEVENVHRNLGENKPLLTAILDGASQIAVPTFVATLTIGIVFVAVTFLDGVAKYLFTPLALAVVFALGTSYFLSRTLVPTMIRYLLASESHHTPNTIFGRAHNAFEGAFERFRNAYTRLLAWNLRHRRTVLGLFILIVLGSVSLIPRVGEDFFPTVDAGQFRLHVRAPAGTRLEQTERYFTQVEDEIRATLGDDARLIIDNIGLPNRSYSMAFGDSATTGVSDGEILVSLKDDRRKGTPAYMVELRERLAAKFPQLTFYFQSADIVSQILNFGLPAPIDVQVGGYDGKKNLEIAQQIVGRLKQIPGVVDVHLHQVTAVPTLHLEVDQTRASQLGLSQQEVANQVFVSLSGSQQVQPNYWVDPQSGISYPVETRVPPHAVDSVAAVESLPVPTRDRPDQPQLLTNLAKIDRKSTAEVTNHVNVQPVYDVYANVQNRDLGSVAREVQKVVDEFRGQQSPGNTIEIRGQAESMQSAFARLGLGLVFAAVIVYLLLVVNFQSWTDPAIILSVLPGALAGVVVGLLATKTTFSVPGLMGAIMAIGVATANSILLVTFANDRRKEGADALTAALDAGRTRMRPVLMTALAMVLGMLPMSLGLGQGGEQNAPLARAVIGGLLVATLTTLMVVPVVYSLLRAKTAPKATVEPELM
ncbi:efflux RND transporter permease subunit [Limnoglobus roseus]|uniref:AcrB/AcrD/AcrF family protein n=1 Tax=Limnoglobus roseus TaxID=2598579 RepID=A0A5C1AGJ4_9BACT|nr:efflux RND transporter permease subunit [Limnoglobus roseus]QEL16234.1 AcrB/AcrD/AcrF family protein [Limnoglobus roseus]